MMTPIFKKTDKQKEATKLLSKEICRYAMLYGGSRSGKTFIAVYSIFVRACKAKSRHVILRYKFNHAKTSLWLDTVPKVLKLCFPELKVQFVGTDFYVLLPNGSEVWIGGLDDAARVEKILGKEYSTIYFNEVSQIPWKSVQVALTRLAEKNDLKKKVYFDMNPPTKKHWAYWLFEKGLNPDTLEPVDVSRYGKLLMNPMDNINNIDEDYITEVLDKLSPEERARFKEGQYADSGEGQAYYAFDRFMNVQQIESFKKVGTVMVGMDFNVNPMTAVIGYYVDKKFHVTDEIYLQNSDTYKMCDELIRRGYKGAWVYPDSTGRNRKTSGKSDHIILKDAGFVVKPTVNPFVRDRVNNMNRLLRDKSIIIDPRCKKLIHDLERVVWKSDDLDEGAEKDLTHISDALGYWCWSLDNLVYKEPAKIELR